MEQGVFGSPKEGDVEYSQVISIDLSAIEPSLAGPLTPVAEEILERRA